VWHSLSERHREDNEELDSLLTYRGR
jgi:hypothetical protein